jgi:hypothetical protein
MYIMFQEYQMDFGWTEAFCSQYVLWDKYIFDNEYHADQAGCANMNHRTGLETSDNQYYDPFGSQGVKGWFQRYGENLKIKEEEYYENGNVIIIPGYHFTPHQEVLNALSINSSEKVQRYTVEAQALAQNKYLGKAISPAASGKPFDIQLFAARPG